MLFATGVSQASYMCLIPSNGWIIIIIIIIIINSSSTYIEPYSQFNRKQGRFDNHLQLYQISYDNKKHEYSSWILKCL